MAGNVYFLNYFKDYYSLRSHLLDAQKTVEEQKGQLVTLSNKLKVIDKDLTRIRDFDAKLRAMINLDDNLQTATSVGGAKPTDFTSDYLPIYRQELLARKMHNFLNQLTTDIQLEQVRQQELVEAFRGDMRLLASTPTIWPTEGWVTSPFCKRTNPFTGRPDFHQGVDISGKIGTPIFSPADGVVTFVGDDGPFGKTMVIKHGSGLVTRYSHLHRYHVKEGQNIQRGEMVADMGNSGRSTGPHLHYEVRLNGTPVDPMRYILN